MASAKTATFKVTARAVLNGYQYHCIVKNSGGSVTSSAATLTVTKTPQGLAVTSRSPRPDIRAEVRGSSTAAGASSSETDSRREQSATVNPRESQSGSCGIRDWVELAVLLMLMLGEALIWHRVSEK